MAFADPTELRRGARFDPVVVGRLRPRFSGELIEPGDRQYDALRRVWNASIDRYPSLIGRCQGPDDVARLVELAAELDVPLAVRGGGHNVAGFGTCDDGIVIDLSPMSTVEVDPLRRTAWVGGGATWGHFDATAHRYGLATTGGQVSTTGVGGLALGGGIGWLMRKHGLTCDNLLGAEVVSAGSRRLTARPGEHEELFWGLRGGGGNFGVVTRLELQLHPVDRVVAGVVLHPLSRARAVLELFRDYTATAPHDVAPFVGFWTPVATPSAPGGLGDAPVVALGACYAGPVSAAERVLAPLRSFASPLFDDIGEMPYPRLQQMLDDGSPAGLQNHARAEYLRALTDDAIDALVEGAHRMPASLSQLFVAALGGAIASVAEDETAFAHRDAPFIVNILAIWRTPESRSEHVSWARSLWEDLRPASAGGAYVNFLGQESEARVRSAYGEAKFARLRGIKTTYDPANLFRLNQNIPPN
ncbi:MAG: FAD-binding oxidoreductase [Actinobacteria bacterium]|nr:FAD-binding oxidoreductase [Actinomycetota bacterium]MBW3650249.1 FAD-binding oxidoreductase [Actinomycetota bacterium]